MHVYDYISFTQPILNPNLDVCGGSFSPPPHVGFPLMAQKR